MNSCKDCKHWTRGTFPSVLFGSCSLITDYDAADSAKLYAWDYEGYSASAYVGEDFCCRHFE